MDNSPVAQSSEDFSVLVLASDLGVDGRSLLQAADQREVWHDCPSTFLPDDGEDFSDLDALQLLRVEGSDKSGNRILRVVGKYFPAPVVSGERLRKYTFRKIFNELPEGPFCIVYMHSTVQREDNSPGLSILRWIYEELPSDYKERLRVLYFVHPGIRSRFVFATLGRFFLSGGLYWKIKYISRLQYLWDDIKKGEVEIPDFVKSHDDILEHRPLTDYGIEPDPLHANEIPTMGWYSLGRNDEKLAYHSYT
ncbi:uncharacterized protein [Aristolochia californica]|uniref:uncharacterized protein n=1 Tax=Aristolochia californica TaxID=171875 RepID=UPI0035E0BDCC